MKTLLKIFIIPLLLVPILTGCQQLEDRGNIDDIVKEEATKQEDIEGTVISKRTTDEILNNDGSEGKQNENKDTKNDNW